MKLPAQCVAVVALVAVLSWNPVSRAQFLFSGGLAEESSTFVVRADGTCSYTNINVEPRAMAEQQVRMMDRFANASDDSEQKPPAAAELKENAPKPLTDEDLVKKLQSMRQDNEDESANPDEQFKATVTNGNVRIETTRSFGSLQDLLAEGGTSWQQATIFQNARFEQNSNGQLVVTLTAPRGMQRYYKSAKAAMKMAGTKIEFQLVLPGKVLTSALPDTDGNTTGFSVDAKKDESLDAMMKFYDAPVVITAEAGGLKIPEPLDSKTLQRTSRSSGVAGGDLPVTDAEPGFVAEPQTITTTTMRVFPGGESYFKDTGQYLARQVGAVISAKIFAPRGRTLQSVSNVRVIKAVDDKGRTVAPAQNNNDAEVESYSTSSGETRADSIPIQLALQLPAPDAQAINEIDGEAIAVTAGSWSEMSLTNLQENATNEIDLSAVLPGAKLLIRKLTASKNNQNTDIELEVKGPPAIKRLDFKAKFSGVEQQMSSSASERRFTTKAGVSTRALSIQAYTFGQEVTGPMSLTVRYPQDLRRERVRFKLTALDLL